MAELVLFEDNRATRELLSLYLARNGHQVRAYAGTENPRMLLSRKPADLILLDLDLGQVNGADLCRQLRQLPAPFNQTPILLLSSISAEAMKRLNLDVDGYIVKMTTVDDVLRQINAYLGKLSQHQTSLKNPTLATAPDHWAEPEWPAGSAPASAEEQNHRAYIALDHQVLDLLGADIGMDVLRQIMAVFIEDLEERTELVITALSGLNHHGIQHQAHALRSSAASYGAIQLTVLCTNIDLAHHSANTQRLREHAHSLQDVTALTINAVHQYLANRAG